MARTLERSPLEMEPFFEVVDPDAVNRLFDSADDRRTSVTLTFEYCGQQVTLTADNVRITPVDSA